MEGKEVFLQRAHVETRTVGGERLELRPSHGGGRNYYVEGSPWAPPLRGCGCFACTEAGDRGIPAVDPEFPPHCEHIDGETASMFGTCMVAGVVLCYACRQDRGILG